MSLQIQTWENRLIGWAHEALSSHSAAPGIDTSAVALEKAYHHCQQITKEHSRTFYLASTLLPAPKRSAARALYAFCRISDDLVDNPSEPGDRETHLDAWRQRTLGQRPPVDDPVALAWADTRARYRIPWRYAEQLISGVACDLDKTRYATFDELAEYCYCVASTVGLMAMHIIGFAGPQAIPYAVKLGVALQLTNILRDVGEDWRRGRLYLPQDELHAFDLSEAEVAAGRGADRWRAFMRFQIERNRRFYAEALPGIAMLDADGRFAIAAAARLYSGILDDIEAHDGDVFSRRAYVSAAGKLRRLPGIWWEARQASRPAAALAQA